LPNASGARFGLFELDFRSGELLKQGRRIRLQDQPLQILALLLEHPGEVVTRAELKRRLWPSDTFVDFDHSLNAAVKRLRETLGDDADYPLYIETLPRHGYRFVAPVNSRDEANSASSHRHAFSRNALFAVFLVGSVAIFVSHLAFRHYDFPEVRSSEPPYSVAVLPFENLSNEPADEVFADSFTEELINQLGHAHSLRVVSRQSVMQYKGAVKTLPQIAHELDVQAIVQGSLLRDDGRLRITLQLVQAVPERHLWAESYERHQDGVIDLQRDVASDVARQVQAALLGKSADQSGLR
jgi:TolB-like protein/DNA-binding winged helix-turn-helix (wHTH) protein